MIVVVGAVSIDLVAVREKFLDGTSNPSDIRLGIGGVGWRVFSSLEAPRRFITALARDPLSRHAREAMQELGGVRVQEVRDRDAHPPLYLALMESGSLKVAASDFRIVERGLDAAFVLKHAGRLAERDMLVLDANLSPPLLAGLVERYAGATRVVFEPVSVEKAARHAAALRGLFLVTPTVEECEALVPGGEGSLAEFMRGRDIAHVVVTRGREGASLYGGSASAGGRLDFAPRRVVAAEDTNGAGDLLLAALLSALHGGAPVEEALRAAMDEVESCLEKGAPG
jgi:sugar/nucleoside kinase (ribokinase family)